MRGSQEMLNVFMLINGKLQWDRQLFAWQSPANNMTATALIIIIIIIIVILKYLYEWET